MINKVNRDHCLIVLLTNLERAFLLSCCLTLSPAPADEANNDEHIEREVDEDCVLDEAVQFDRPDKHQRQDSLRQFTHIAQCTTVAFFSGWLIREESKPFGAFRSSFFQIFLVTACGNIRLT